MTCRVVDNSAVLVPVLTLQLKQSHWWKSWKSVTCTYAGELFLHSLSHGNRGESSPKKREACLSMHWRQMWNQVGSTLITSLNSKNKSLQVIEEHYIHLAFTWQDMNNLEAAKGGGSIKW